VYCVVVFGVTVTAEPTKFPGVHVKVPPATVDDAIRVAIWPAQTVAPVAVTTGCGFTVTVTGVNGDGQPALAQEIITWPLPF
jgi:hypothetical protein